MTCGYCGNDEASGFLTYNALLICWPCFRRLIGSGSTGQVKPSTLEKP